MGRISFWDCGGRAAKSCVIGAVRSPASLVLLEEVVLSFRLNSEAQASSQVWNQDMSSGPFLPH